MDIKKWVLCGILLIFSALLAVADTEKIGDHTWSYSVEQGMAVVEGVSPTSGVLSIPSMLGGGPVTSIGASAFYGCSGLTSVTIPASVTSIGSSAFYGCSGLTTVTIPGSVTSIGEFAFDGCSGLTSVIIGEGVRSIGVCSFRDCKKITAIAIPKSVVSVPNCAALQFQGFNAPFSGCTGIRNFVYDGRFDLYDLFGYSKDCLTNIVIAESVTSIGTEAFYGCSGLTSLTIPDSVTSIGKEAFSCCSGLRSVTIGNGVTSIGSYAFNGCSGLTSLTIPDSVTSIGKEAFSCCSGLRSVTIGNGVTSIGSYAFSGCSGLTTVTIPDSVTSIGDHAFDGCSGLMSVTIGNGVTSFGDSAFYGCGGLTSVTIPDSVTSIGMYAFANCFELTSVTIGRNVEIIDRSAFYDCYRIATVHIDNLDAWNSIAFGNLSANPLWSSHGSTTRLVLNGFNVTDQDTTRPICHIDDLVAYCMKSYADGTSPLLLYDVHNPTYDAMRLFINGSEVRDLVIPDGVGAIRYGAFFHCHAIRTVTIPASVTNIATEAFVGCSGLQAFYVDGNNPNYSSRNGMLYTKDGKRIVCGKNGDAVIPEGTTSINARAFTDYNNLTSLVIPPSLSFIGSAAFLGCYALETVDITDVAAWCGIEYGSARSYHDSEDGQPLRHARRLLIDNDAVTEITIPPNVQQVNIGAFAHCPYIVRALVPMTTQIDNGAFSATTSIVRYNPVQTIVLDANGGVVVPEEMSRDFGAAYGDLPTPMKEECLFAGWSLMGETITASNRVTVPTNHTLAAIWKNRDNVVGSTGKPVAWEELGGGTKWVAAVDATAKDGYCLRSGDVLPCEVSTIGTTLTGSGTLTFDWRISSGRGDFARVYVDDAVWRSITRSESWATVSLDIPIGEHMIRWAYERGSGSASGEDAAFIDNVDWRPHVSLVVSSAFGTATPASGVNTFLYGDDIAAYVAPSSTDRTRNICVGWTGTGSVPASGSEASVTFTITNDSSIVWNWRTEHWTEVAVSGGTSDFTPRWVAAGENVAAVLSTSVLRYKTTLSGDTDGVTLDGLTLRFTADRPRRISVAIQEVKVPLAVESAHGTPSPANGAHALSWGTVVPASMAEPEPTGGVRYRCTGWTGTGDVPANGSGTKTVFTLESASSLKWNWTTNFWISLALSGPVETVFTNQWAELGGAIVADLAVSAPYCTLSLSGDTEGVVLDEAAMTLSIPADRPRDIALSATELTLAGALDAPGLVWRTDGAAGWFPQLAVSLDGEDAARSGEVAGDDVSGLETTLDGPRTFSWSWRLDATGNGTAGVDVLVDGKWLEDLAPTGAWAEATLDIGDGTHTVRFEYWNAGADAADACAYIDKVSFTGGGLVWSVEGTTLTISGDGPMPDYGGAEPPYQGYADMITKIVVEEGVTQIGDNAFQGSQSVTLVSLPETLVSIGIGAFADCVSLDNVVIPNSVAEIGEGAFSGCDSLEMLYLQQRFVPYLDDLGVPDTCSVANTDVYNFVRRLYNLCLDREPDWAGCAHWAKGLTSGAKNGAMTAYGFFLSAEMKRRNLSNADYVEILYRALMDRAPDAAGKAHWVELLNNGISRTGIFQGFAESAEFTRICNKYGIARGNVDRSRLEPRDVNRGVTQFVARCYTKALGRNYDVAGLNHWCTKINSSPTKKATAIQVSESFLTSAEFQRRKLSNSAFVDVLYQTFLGRAPDAAGKKHWVNKLNSGISRNAVMAGFYNSKEFAAIMARYGIR